MAASTISAGFAVEATELSFDKNLNKGATLLDYDDFEQKISSIDGDELIGGGGGTSEDLNTIIVDLPVSDGSDIQSGYAYIETSTRNVKVKA